MSRGCKVIGREKFSAVYTLRLQMLPCCVENADPSLPMHIWLLFTAVSKRIEDSVIDIGQALNCMCVVLNPLSVTEARKIGNRDDEM
jgi:hypothetical protein